MNRLGNEQVRTGTGPRIQIRDPAAAEDLLELAVENAHAAQRVIFFCACEWPALPGEDHNCHRVTVADLVLAAARRRGVALEIVEWPGGEPGLVQVDLSPALFRRLRAGAKSIPLPSPSGWAGIAWGSPVRARSELGGLDGLTGPARYERGLGWYMPLLERIDGASGPDAARRESQRFRQDHGLMPRKADR